MSHTPYELNVDEFNALRAEITSRQSIMNSQSSNASMIIIATWTAGFALLGLQVANSLSPRSFFSLLLPVGQMLAFAATVMLLIPMAVKSGENLQQMVSIGTYILIFFEEPCRLHPERYPKQFYWETADKKENAVIHDIGKGSPLKSLVYNSEYPLLAIASDSFYCLALSNLFTSAHIQFSSSPALKTAFSAFSILISIIIFIGTIAIWRSSNIKRNLQERRNSYIRQYLDLAYENGIFSKEDYTKACSHYSDTLLSSHKKALTFFRSSSSHPRH